MLKKSLFAATALVALSIGTTAAQADDYNARALTKNSDITAAALAAGNTAGDKGAVTVSATAATASAKNTEKNPWLAGSTDNFNASATAQGNNVNALGATVGNRVGNQGSVSIAATAATVSGESKNVGTQGWGTSPDVINMTATAQNNDVTALGITANNRGGDKASIAVSATAAAGSYKDVEKTTGGGLVSDAYSSDVVRLNVRSQGNDVLAAGAAVNNRNGNKSFTGVSANAATASASAKNISGSTYGGATPDDIRVSAYSQGDDVTAAGALLGNRAGKEASIAVTAGGASVNLSDIEQKAIGATSSTQMIGTASLKNGDVSAYGYISQNRAGADAFIGTSANGSSATAYSKEVGGEGVFRPGDIQNVAAYTQGSNVGAYGYVRDNVVGDNGFIGASANGATASVTSFENIGGYGYHADLGARNATATMQGSNVTAAAMLVGNTAGNGGAIGAIANGSSASAASTNIRASSR